MLQSIKEGSQSLAGLAGSFDRNIGLRAGETTERVRLQFVTAVVTFAFDPSSSNYPAEQSRSLESRLLEETQALPGVRSAALAGRTFTEEDTVTKPKPQIVNQRFVQTCWRNG